MKGTVKRVKEKRLAYRTPPRGSGPRTRAPFKRVTRRQIRAVVQKIVDALHPEKVILFGSYAYGKPTIDSDVDILIVMESEERPVQRAIRAYRAVSEKTFPMDILVRTPAELEHRLKIKDWFLQDIVEQGKVLYERRTVERVAA